MPNSLRKIAENEAELGVNFKIVETGGLSMRSILQKSNPLKDIGCDNQDCLPCKDRRGAGGDCEGGSVNYELECKLCPDDSKSVYIGESSRSLFVRSTQWPYAP